MTFWTDLSSLFDGLKSAGRAVMNVALPAIAGITAAARKLVDGAIDGARKAFIPPPATERERIDRDLHDTNERIQRLRERFRQRGSLSPADQAENRHLKDRRQHLMAELEALEKVDLAEEIVEEEESIEALDITEAQFHLLQYQVGQGSRNKNCAVCGRKMVLQWENKLLVVTKRDQFFWGCTGFYVQGREINTQSCTHTESLSAEDFSVLLNTNRSEFECTSDQLAQVTFQQNPERIRDAIRSIRSKLAKKKQGLNRYRCPVHGERMILREKENFIGLHDQFYLRCPRHAADNFGCNYFVKLKSAAQISAALEAAGENGVIQVLGLGTSPVSRQGKKWDLQDEAQLRLLVGAGKSIDEIALLMGRNRNGISSRMDKLRLG